MIERILSTWSWHPSVICGVLGLLALYLAVIRLRPPWRLLWFVLGLATIVLALTSPLDILSDRYLFSAHMIQHLLLFLVAPPLLLVGIPRIQARRFIVLPLPRQAEHILGQPLIAWFLGVGTFWIWHIPALYAATLNSERVHIAEHLSVLITGSIFWWPVFGPAVSRPLNTFFSLAYLFTAAVANSVLGIILTFAPALIYHGYQAPIDSLHILPLFRQTWGLSALADQQLGGLFMWVGGGVVFLIAMLSVLARWYCTPDQDNDQGVEDFSLPSLQKRGRQNA